MSLTTVVTSLLILTAAPPKDSAGTSSHGGSIIWFTEGNVRPVVDVLTEKGAFSAQDRYAVSFQRVGDSIRVQITYNNSAYVITIRDSRFPGLDLDKKSISPKSRRVPSGGILITIPFGESHSDCGGLESPSPRNSITIEALSTKVDFLETAYSLCSATVKDIRGDPAVNVRRGKD